MDIKERSNGDEHVKHMSPSPLCTNCGFPLCHYRTKNCILYIGGLQAVCGSCGLAQEAKTLFDFSSAFMTDVEQRMSQRLYTIATAQGKKCTYTKIKNHLTEEFGASAWNRYKTTARQDLESLAELRRIKATQKIEHTRSNPKIDRQILSQSLSRKRGVAPPGALGLSLGRNAYMRKESKVAWSNGPRASMSSPASSQATKIVKNESGRVVYADLPSLIKLVAGKLSEEERKDYEGTILLTYREFCTATELLETIINLLDVALAGECFGHQKNLPEFLNKVLLQIKEDTEAPQIVEIHDDIEALLLDKLASDTLGQEKKFWNSLLTKIKFLVGAEDGEVLEGSAFLSRKSRAKSRDSISRPEVLGIITGKIEAPPLDPLDDLDDLGRKKQLLHIPSKDLAFQLTLIAGVCFKQINPHDMVSSKRKRSDGYKNVLSLYNKLTKWVQQEFLADNLVLEERVNVFIKFVKIAHKCAELGNFFCCIALVGCFVKELLPDDLWERIPQSAKFHYQTLFDAFINIGKNTREGYDAALKAFKKKFYMPDFRYFLQTLELMIDRLPSLHKDNALINFSKFSAISRLLTSFFANQHLPIGITANHETQNHIAVTLARCGPVNSGSDVLDMKKYTDLKESVKTQVMYESLNRLGFG
jgi:hypothetical protein